MAAAQLREVRQAQGSEVGASRLRLTRVLVDMARELPGDLASAAPERAGQDDALDPSGTALVK